LEPAPLRLQDVAHLDQLGAHPASDGKTYRPRPGLSPVASCSAICNGTADNRSRAEYEHNPGHSFGSRNHYVSLTFVEGG